VSGWGRRATHLIAAFSLPLSASIALAQSAGGSASAYDWLQRLYQATGKLSYTGTFVYQHGHQSEVSRVTRLVDANGPQERIELLDGSPREIIRSGDEIRAILPATMTVRIERAASTRPLLPMLPSQVKDLEVVYEIRKGDTERIAGFEAQAIVLYPRDALRYGHRFWADTGTGMLLKAQTFDERREVVEQFMFTSLRIGQIARADLRSRFQTGGRDWRIEETPRPRGADAQIDWVLKSAPAGFRKLTEMRRTFGSNVEVQHMVISDGLATASVFIEAATRDKPNPPPPGLSRQGAINIFTRKLEAHVITVVGEVPAASVEAIAIALEPRQGSLAKP
jgi:sigma-E factor negative regulatory protein RseB